MVYISTGQGIVLRVLKAVAARRKGFELLLQMLMVRALFASSTLFLRPKRVCARIMMGVTNLAGMQLAHCWYATTAVVK